MLNIVYEKGKYYLNKENEKPYIIDINKKEILGKSGKPIKTLPVSKNLYSDFVRNKNPQIQALANLGYYSNLQKDAFFEILDNVDKLANVGITITDATTDELYDIDIKRLIKYCRNEKIDLITLRYLRDYKQKEMMQQFKEKYPQFQSYDNAYDVYKRLPQMYQNYFDVYGYYIFIRGYECLNIEFILKRYIENCVILKIEPQKEKNFLQLAKDTHNAVVALNDKISQAKIEKNYKPHEKAFNFKTDKFSVIVPKIGRDLIAEGCAMHHCVGSYVRDIENNKTYIVFVRKNDNITQPYITAEIRLNGEIGQYFLSYDRRISEQDDIEFKEQFQTWLRANW